ncbi:hypothetical protein B0J14DRAFT_656181 [Halenospora varia]|nr:hypothetical protein B0J14DRAFT_656181 [Halenospora varia]
MKRHGSTNWSKGFMVEVELNDGRSTAYFLKIIPDNAAALLGYGRWFSDKNKWWYTGEFIDFEEDDEEYHESKDEPDRKPLDPPTPNPEESITTLENLHKESISPTGKFGFPITTYKGHIPINTGWCVSWEEFFTRQFRAEVKWEKSVRGKNNVMDALVEKLFEKVIPRSLRPLLTGGRCIKPTLCHGDLWHGNIARNRKTHKLMLFHSCAFREDMVVSGPWNEWTERRKASAQDEMKRLIAKFLDSIDSFVENVNV